MLSIYPRLSTWDVLCKSHSLPPPAHPPPQKRKEKKERKEEGKGLFGVEVLPSLPGQLSAFAMQITCAEHQKVSGERRQEEQEGQEKFCWSSPRAHCRPPANFNCSRRKFWQLSSEAEQTDVSLQMCLGCVGCACVLGRHVEGEGK